MPLNDSFGNIIIWLINYQNNHRSQPFTELYWKSITKHPTELTFVISFPVNHFLGRFINVSRLNMWQNETQLELMAPFENQTQTGEKWNVEKSVWNFVWITNTNERKNKCTSFLTINVQTEIKHYIKYFWWPKFKNGLSQI